MFGTAARVSRRPGEGMSIDNECVGLFHPFSLTLTKLL
jgi:hypothetical protein